MGPVRRGKQGRGKEMCPHRAGQDDPGGRRHPGGAGTAQAAGPVQLFGIRSAGAWNAPAGSTCPLAGGSLPPSRRQRTPGTRQPPATSNAPPRRAARKPRPCGPRARFHLRPFAGSWVGSNVDRHPVFVPDLALRRTVRPCGPVDGAAAKRHGPGRGDRKGSTRQPEHAELHCASNRKTSWYHVRTCDKRRCPWRLATLSASVGPHPLPARKTLG